MQTNEIISFIVGNIKIKVLLDNILELEGKVRSEMHSHALYELHMQLGTEAQFETEEGLFPLYKDDIVLVMPDVYHHFAKEEKGSEISSIAFSFEKTTQGSSGDEFSKLKKRMEEIGDFLLLKSHTSLTEYPKKIIEVLYSKKPFRKEGARAYLLLLFRELLNALLQTENALDGEAEEAEYDRRTARIETYFNDYYMQDASLAQLADFLYLSKKQTQRMIYKTYQTGFRERLVKSRIRSAKKLLRDGKLTVRQVGDAVGYRSYNGFFEAFKKEMGMTPHQYQKEHTTVQNENE